MAGVTAPRKIPANLTNRDCPHPPRGVTKAQFHVHVPLIPLLCPGGWGHTFMQINVRGSNNLRIYGTVKFGRCLDQLDVCSVG